MADVRPGGPMKRQVDGLAPLAAMRSTPVARIASHRCGYQAAPAICRVVALSRLKRLVTPIMRTSEASPFSS